MSFSSDVKKELCKISCFDRETLKAELYGMLLFGKTFGADKIVFTTESSYAAKRVSSLLENLYMPIIERQIQINTALSDEGLRNPWGACIGRILLSKESSV